MVEVNEGIGGPQFAAQFLPSDYLARVSKRANKNSEGLLLQLHPIPVFPEFARVAIHLERAEPKERTERRVHVSPRSHRSTRAVHRVYQPARQFTTYIELSHSR